MLFFPDYLCTSSTEFKMVWGEHHKRDQKPCSIYMREVTRKLKNISRACQCLTTICLLKKKLYFFSV